MSKPFYVMLEGMTALELLKLIHSDVVEQIETSHITNHNAILYKTINILGEDIYVFSGIGWAIEFSDNGYDKLTKEEAIKTMYWEA